MLNPDVALTYLEFVAERHRIWTARQNGDGQPWTDDPILRTRKFTNVYRVLDYGSQFLVRDLLEERLSPQDTLARCFLYRYTNLPATWYAARSDMGRFPLIADLNDDLVRVMQGRVMLGKKVFSGAYIVKPPLLNGEDKPSQVVEFTRRFAESPLMDAFLQASDHPTRYSILRSIPNVGPFMAMQILTDWGYSQYAGVDQENDFIVAGPGAIKGAKFIDPDATPAETMQWAAEAVWGMPDCPLLYGRKPSLMDIQNTLCEFSKYRRYELSDAPAAVRPYAPANPGKQPRPTLPNHWELDRSPDTQ